VFFDETIRLSADIPPSSTLFMEGGRERREEESRQREWEGGRGGHNHIKERHIHSFCRIIRQF
jgi:hypothetical protein